MPAATEAEIHQKAGYASACLTRSGAKGSARRRLPVA
jgi:hypothetical protein